MYLSGDYLVFLPVFKVLKRHFHYCMHTFRLLYRLRCERGAGIDRGNLLQMIPRDLRFVCLLLWATFGFILQQKRAPEVNAPRTQSQHSWTRIALSLYDPL